MKVQTLPSMGQSKKTKERSFYDFFHGIHRFGTLLSGSIDKFAFLFAALLLGRVDLVGGLAPFGLAFFAASYRSSFNQLAVGAFAIIGIFSRGISIEVLLDTISFIVFMFLMIPYAKKGRPSSLRIGLCAFLSMLMPSIAPVWMQGFLIFDILRLLFEAFVVFVMVFIFRNAFGMLSAGPKRRVFSNEEVISVAIVLSLCVSGISDIGIFWFSVKNIISIILILVFAYRFGTGVGSAIGVTMGLIISMSTTITPLVIGSYAFCGLLCGVFRNFGRIGSGLGFILGNAILTIYLNGSTEAIIQISEITVAIAIFMVIPINLIDKLVPIIENQTIIGSERRDYLKRIKELTVIRLTRFSKAFGELARTFEEISETKSETNKQDISALFDRVAERICKDCSLCIHCWDRNFYSTYQVTFKIVEKLEEKGWIEERDVPEYFKTRCVRLEDFVNATNNLYEVFKVDMIWKKKIGESRGLVSQQLKGLSSIISGLAEEINADVEFKEEQEDAILVELDKAGIKADEVVVFQNRTGQIEVSVFVKNNDTSDKLMSSLSEKRISQALGKKVTRHNEEATIVMGSYLVFKFIQKEKFSVLTGVARSAKNGEGISGDSYTFMKLDGGKYLVALSDGMGTGRRASRNSNAAIHLLEEFLISGFDKDTTVKIINSILVLKSTDESFATIDLTVLDLQSGNAEFIKIGAMPTFIKRDDRVELVRAASLPAGILQNIDLELSCRKLISGDFIIMISDGILDSFDSEDKEVKLIEFICELNSGNPQLLADRILDRACENYGGEPQDDLTVVVAKVWEHS